MTGFIYIWYDTKHKMFYLGSHNGTADDGYVCSNTRMKAAYKKRPETFKRRILEWVHTTEQRKILECEQRWLDMINDDELSNGTNKKNNTIRYYNVKKLAAGGNGGVGSNGALVGKKKYYNPTSNEQGFFIEGSQPSSWCIGVVPGTASSTKTVWIHHPLLSKNKRVSNLTNELISDGWVSGRLRTKTLLSGMSKGGTKAMKKMDKTVPRPGRSIITPMGEFNKIKTAATALKTSSATIWARLNNKNMPEWHYKENN